MNFGGNALSTLWKVKNAAGSVKLAAVVTLVFLSKLLAGGEAHGLD